jgi:hypothetical protein
MGFGARVRFGQPIRFPSLTSDVMNHRRDVSRDTNVDQRDGWPVEHAFSRERFTCATLVTSTSTGILRKVGGGVSIVNQLLAFRIVDSYGAEPVPRTRPLAMLQCIGIAMSFGTLGLYAA